MYNPKSSKAAEFIDDTEIRATLRYAEENRVNAALIDGILRKARERKGLDHREASVLLACALPEQNVALLGLAREIKQAFYGNRIVLFAPLYLSNYCINGCVYCPYQCHNKTIPRRKLSQPEIAREVAALQDMGHKRLALETGEHPLYNPLEYVLESLETIYSVKHRNGAIRRANVNIAATTVEAYRKLRDAGIGTYILFQETYHRETYEQLHPTGPKSDYAWHTEAMDRAMQGGVEDVGLGVLFGLKRYKYEFTALLMHAEHLEAAFGVGPHTVSVPRVKFADGVNPGDFKGALSDEAFAKVIACIRLAVPYTGMIISTREGAELRARALALGVSQLSGGSRTSVGGYAVGEEAAAAAQDTEQFEVSDHRTLDEVVRWLMELGYIPSFCTACYRQGRTGDRFMQLVKTNQIQNCCHSNALMTLEEFLLDYASPATRQLGERLIESEIGHIPLEKMRRLVQTHLVQIKAGERDFRV
ncbi:MAG: [FeFe] hydrogenase H-cluster radical SAM maturase HydG [Oscillospiraceae bacterium]|jgi:2-iminoacetate synthase|nr:[FeFe] hydrogenase H-cluster radical SAM maturase HydG [Oscillospiraceae bacterium]